MAEPEHQAQEPAMKQFLIKYRFTHGTKEEWHQDIARFIANLDSDLVLKGRISYRCMKNAKDSDYYHLARAADDQAPKELQQRDWFKLYTEKTRLVAGGEVEVLPLEIIAETAEPA
jgi:hypothetical protein